MHGQMNYEAIDVLERRQLAEAKMVREKLLGSEANSLVGFSPSTLV